MDIETIFTAYRPLLFSIAYNMLGSVMDAEDCVQETLLRWHQANIQESDEAIRSPRAYLSAVITNLAIDHLRSSRVKRESAGGVWLPEPIVTEGPEEHAEMGELLSFAFLRILETLSPLERAVFLLRQIFDYEYEEIGRMLGKTGHSCRQIVYRARQHLAAQRPRYLASSEQSEQLVKSFIEASEGGRIEDLLGLLAEDVVLYSEGGELRWPMPLHGKEQIVEYLQKVLANVSSQTVWHWRFANINGQTGLMIYAYGRMDAVMSFEIEDGKIQEIDLLVQAEKLARIQTLTEEPS